jgi:hypothetical protein
MPFDQPDEPDHFEPEPDAERDRLVRALLRDPGFREAMLALVEAHIEAHLEAQDEAEPCRC